MRGNSHYSKAHWAKYTPMLWTQPGRRKGAFKVDGSNPLVCFRIVHQIYFTISEFGYILEKYGALAELVEGTFLLRKHLDKNLDRWFESNTLRQITWKCGRVRFNAPVLKTDDQKWSVGSNPTTSARMFKNYQYVLT